MQQQGVNMVRHYRDMAYMGFIQVILHLRTILGIMREACRSIDTFHPDMVILVDYPSFNLKIAKYVHQHHPDIPVYYYIAPKLWAWKAWRLKAIKKNVDRVFSILPFEVEWFGSRGCQVDYIGNPCVDAVEGRNHKGETLSLFPAQRVDLLTACTGIAGGKPCAGNPTESASHVAGGQHLSPVPTGDSWSSLHRCHLPMTRLPWATT